MTDGTRIVAHDALTTIAGEIVRRAGSEGEEPQLVADNLIYANLTGHDSHGIGMLPRYIKCVLSGVLTPNQHARIVSDHGAMVSIDGGAGYGQVIGGEAMDIGIERARQHGVCVLTIQRSFHLCRIGAWGQRCAAAGMVSMHHVNVVGHRGLVAPFRGSDARYSTNPYCCVLPGTQSNPDLVLDFATSVVAQGKVRVAKNKGERMPPGILIDGEGEPSEDPEVMFGEPRGAIRSFGEHKGYGMALVNELLAGVLSGGGTCRPDTEVGTDSILNNMLSVIFDPTRLVTPSFYEQETDATLAHVRASPPLDPREPVLTPGDPERATMQQRLADGIPVDAETWRELVEAGGSVGLEPQWLESRV